MVPSAAVRGEAASVVVDAGDAGEHGGVRSGGRRREVRDAALQVHIHQREGEEERAVLLAGVADVGGGGDTARMEAVQAPKDAHVSVVHTPSEASFALLIDGRGEAAALHCAPDLAEAQPR